MTGAIYKRDLFVKQIPPFFFIDVKPSFVHPSIRRRISRAMIPCKNRPLHSRSSSRRSTGTRGVGRNGDSKERMEHRNLFTL